ncbi:MAG: hypothetical protein ACPGTU_05685, partial [Myxococcota bacterium]
DLITLDVTTRRLDVHADLSARHADWIPPAPKYKRGALAKFAALVSSASEGAVTGFPNLLVTPRPHVASPTAINQTTNPNQQVVRTTPMHLGASLEQS